MTPQHDYLAARKPTKLVVGLVHTAADPGDEFLSRSRPASELCCVTISIPVAQQQLLTLHKKTHSMVIELASFFFFFFVFFVPKTANHLLLLPASKNLSARLCESN